MKPATILQARDSGTFESSRVHALRLPGRAPGSARQADVKLLAGAPAGFLDTTHFDTVRFPPPDWAADAFAKAARDGSLAYTGYRGHPDVLEAVGANIGLFTGVNFDPERELILTPGTQAALFDALSSLVDADDQVLVVDPDYLFTERILRFLGARVTHIPMTGGEHPHIDLNALEAAIKQGRPKLLVFSHPNNPTGAVYPKDVIAGIARLAQQYDVMVLVDELYARLVYKGTIYHHLVAEPGMKERTITLLGPSKTESLSGYRLGVVAAPARVIAAIEDLQSITALRAPAYAQHVLKRWLKDDHSWLADRLDAFEGLRALTSRQLRRLPWLNLAMQGGTAYAWPDVSALTLADEVVAEALLQKAGVLVSPGYQFGPSGPGHFRVCYARDEAEWDLALNRIVEVLDSLAQQAGLPRATAG